MEYRILIVGSGAREHAITRSISKTQIDHKLFCIASNKHPGIINICDELILGDIKAVDGLNFFVRKGETLGLVGESGCGKSTTGRSILQLIRPTSGSVKLEGNELTELDGEDLRAFRRRMQMVFQDPYSSLNPRFKVKNIIAEPIKFFQKNIDEAKISQNINDLIDIVGMSRQSLERYPHEFSGGQRQRISIARALATRPRLLICDEPTSALDVSIQAQVLNLLKDLQDQLNLTILFISHDLPVIRQMCDRTTVLKNGEVCETDVTENIFNKPKHSYTKELLDLMPKIEAII